jgi:hypothetical protein
MNHCTERAHSSFGGARSAALSVAGSAVHWFSTMPSWAELPRASPASPGRATAAGGARPGSPASVRHAGRKLRVAVAEIGRAPRLVVGCDRFQAIAEAARHFGRVVGEAVCGFARQPAAVVLQALRQVPVIQREVGVDALAFQFGQQALVEVEAGLVPGTFAVGCTRAQAIEKR